MLRFAILSLLSDCEMTGYEVTQAFNASVAFFWNARSSQIYPELHRMEQEELVCSSDVPQQGKPNKRPYKITDKGNQALKEWIITPPLPYNVRDELQIRAFNFGKMPLESAKTLLKDKKHEHATRLEHYHKLAKQFQGPGLGAGAPIGEKSGWRIALEAGIRIETAYSEWCDWAAEMLSQSWEEEEKG